MRAVQKHYNNLRFSMLSAMNETEGTDMAVEDAGAASAVHSLNDAQIEVTTGGIPYGEIALSYAVVGDTEQELDERGAEVNRGFVEVDAKVVKETFGQAAVWFQRYIGAQRKALPRPVLVSSGLTAALAPVYGAPIGHKTCKHLDGKPPLAVFKTQWGTAYYYDLFAGADVGHSLILGSTGSGKSFLLNFLLFQSLQYNPKIVILDLGRSYKTITELVGGSYLEMSLEDSGEESSTSSVGAGLRPFQLDAGERAFTFLTQWVTRILSIGGYDAKGEDINEIRARVIDVYELEREERTLGKLAAFLPPRMKPALARWVEDGQWASTFDGPPPTREEAKTLNPDWQVVDLAGAVNFKDWCAAALFFMFERLRIAMDDESERGRVKIMVVDEGWLFLTDPSVVAYLAEAAKTWRKRLGVLIIATQSLQDLSKSAETKALLESLPSRLFLANSAFPAKAAEIFEITEAERQTVMQLRSRGQMFLHRASGDKVVLNLDVDDESYWLYTSSASDAAKRQKMIDKYGLVAAIQRLAAGLGVDDDDLGGDVTTLLS